MINAYFFLYSEARDMPFPGGWTKVLASSKYEARKLVRAVHPDVNLLPVYEDMLTEREMDRAGKHTSGHRGHFCRELIMAREPRWHRDPANLIRVVLMAMPPK